MSGNNKIAAVVVTYNRLEFLKDLLAALKAQTRLPDEIIVVNNSSSDGTDEWLAGQDGLVVVTQENSGSSGGQFTSVRTAYERGNDYIWIMDDDILPAPDCLEQLEKHAGPGRIVAPLRYTPENRPYINDVIKLNMKNPFRSIWERIISPEDLGAELIRAEGITFEGPLVHRSLVASIGFPEKKFFIFADDTEYMLRALKNGIEIYISAKAVMHRRLPAPPPGKTFDWKAYYVIRNVIALDVLHGNPAIRLIRPWAYFFRWHKAAKNKSERQTVRKAFVDGFFYKSANK